MFKILFKWSAWCLVLVLFAAVLVGCGKEEPAKPDTETQKDVGKLTASKPSAEVLTKLASFDALDGNTDKIVSNCASCALGMKGNSENNLKVGDYTLHFCSANCATEFGKDTNNKILALEIPKK